MCGGREGSSGCSMNDQTGQQARGTMDAAWIWVVTTLSLWLGLMLVIWVLTVCSHRQRRHRCLNKVLGPLCAKLGVKVAWGGPDFAGEREGAGDTGVHVYCTPAAWSDMHRPPPSYEMAMTYVNHAYTHGPIAPPSYEQSTGMTSSQSSNHDVTVTSEEMDVTAMNSAIMS